jgi:CRP-like cAMP-binding protein
MSTTGTSPRFSAAALVDLDPELLEGAGPDAVRAARRQSQVPMLEIPTGPWQPTDALGDSERRFWGAVVLDGLLVREVALGNSKAIELLGPGDLTTTGDPIDRLLPMQVTWNAATPVRVALLDGHLTDVARHRPAIVGRLVRRAAAQVDRMEVTRAISQLPRVEQRLLALFWHLGERWGRMSAAGVVIPVSLSHATLGQVVGARRPTVSLALKDLAAGGLINKRDDGSWLLAHGSAASLEPADTRAGAAGSTGRLVRPTIFPADADADAAAHASPEGEVPEPGTARARAPVAVPDDQGLADLQARVRLLRRECEAQRLRVSATLDRARATREQTLKLREALSATRDPA